MSLAIRRASREDAPGVLRLIEALAEYEHLDPPDEAARLRLVEHGWGDRPKFEIWLADQGGDVVGYAFIFETYSSFLCRPTLYIEDIFVAPAARGQGVGKALFQHVLRLSRERECGRMEWVCLDWNRPAQEFYGRLGARHMTEWYSYRLIPGEYVPGIDPLSGDLETC